MTRDIGTAQDGSKSKMSHHLCNFRHTSGLIWIADHLSRSRRCLTVNFPSDVRAHKISARVAENLRALLT